MTLRYQTFLSCALVPLAIYLGIASGFFHFGQGRDYLNYFSAYSEVSLTDTLDIVRFEPGFVMTAWIAKFWVGLEYAAFSAAIISGTLLIKFHLFSQYRRPILTIIFYLCCWYPFHEYTQIRTAVALTFCMLSADFLLKGRLLAFAIAISLASSFHASALILAVAIPVACFASHFRLHIVILAISLLTLAGEKLSSLVFSVSAHLNPLTEIYVANLDQSAVNMFSGANILTVALLASILVSGSLKGRESRSYFILALFGMAAAVALQAVPVFSHRIKEIFLVFLVPLAFNIALTKKTLSQYASAVALAVWSLYSAVSSGIIGVGT